jgi:hypothetical protein
MKFLFITWDIISRLRKKSFPAGCPKMPQMQGPRNPETETAICVTLASYQVHHPAETRLCHTRCPLSAEHYVDS